MNIIKKLFKKEKKAIIHDMQREICNCPICGASPEVDRRRYTSWEYQFGIYCSKYCGFQADCRIEIKTWGQYFIMDDEFQEIIYKQLFKSWNQKVKDINHKIGD